MKIIGIMAFVEVFILITIATFAGIDIDLVFSAANQFWPELLGGILIIYPFVLIVMWSKKKIKYWNFLGIAMVTFSSVVTMLVLSILFRDIKYYKIYFMGYYIQVIYSILFILILRHAHGTIKLEKQNSNNEKESEDK